MHEALLSQYAHLIARLTTNGQPAELLAEVEKLARSIALMRTDLQRLDPGPLVTGHIPAATDELDAVVAHTASATDAILQVCEELEQAGTPDRPADAVLLQDATTRIYEACSFQDITGQRISKVVTTLKMIENKVNDIITVFGYSGTASTPTPPSLTNGPQLPAMAMDQADIDKLLAEF